MERRKDFTRAVTLRLLEKEDVDRLISDLQAARKLCLRRGGNVTVTVRDAKNEDVRCFLLIDLTQDALRRHN